MPTPFEERLMELLDERDAQRPRNRRRTIQGRREQPNQYVTDGQWVPDGHDVRVTPRGKAQTSYWKARSVAENSLVTRIDESIKREPTREDILRINEQIPYKPRMAPWLAKLNQRPFQSRDQWLEELERF